MTGDTELIDHEQSKDWIVLKWLSVSALKFTLVYEFVLELWEVQGLEQLAFRSETKNNIYAVF